MAEAQWVRRHPQRAHAGTDASHRYLPPGLVAGNARSFWCSTHRPDGSARPATSAANHGGCTVRPSSLSSEHLLRRVRPTSAQGVATVRLLRRQ
jgi:hypothetical protein